MMTAGWMVFISWLNRLHHTICNLELLFEPMKCIEEDDPYSSVQSCTPKKSALLAITLVTLSRLHTSGFPSPP